MLLIAPVTLLVCDRLGVPPVPFLIAEVLASNIGGTATLIGDPPNIIIASRAGLSFNDFLLNLAPIVADPDGGLHAACAASCSAPRSTTTRSGWPRSWPWTSAR